MTTLTFRVREVYGRVLYYPDCPASQAIAAAANRVSLSTDQIARLSQAFEIVTLAYLAK